MNERCDRNERNRRNNPGGVTCCTVDNDNSEAEAAAAAAADTAAEAVETRRRSSYKEFEVNGKIAVVKGQRFNICINPYYLGAFELYVNGIIQKRLVGGIFPQLVLEVFVCALLFLYVLQRFFQSGLLFHQLGELSAEAHAGIGRLLNELKLDCVVAVGHWMTHLAHAAQGNVYHFDTLATKTSPLS